MIKVLVVDDSVVVRRLVTSALEGAPGIEVVGVAVNGREAVAKVDQLTPDVVTLDIEMPEMDGLEALAVIRARHPRLPVIMFSTLTEHGARQTLDALALGATDYVTKPTGAGGLVAAVAAVRNELVPRIVALTSARAGTHRADQLRPAPRAVPPRVRQRNTRSVGALLIGCSTGGPDALARVLADLPPDLPVPVLVVQHMPPVFTRMLAERLDAACGPTVREASDGAVLRPGAVLVAPGDHHLVLAREDGQAVARLNQEPPENFCRPAVDVLLRSVKEVYGGNVLVVVLTGMGRDGLRGTQELAERGATVLVQDQETSVVWGMPGAIAEAGLADEVLPLDRIGARISTLTAPTPIPAPNPTPIPTPTPSPNPTPILDRP